MAIIYEKRDRIAYLTLNRPEAMNAIDPQTREEIAEASEDFNSDPDSWVLVLTGGTDRPEDPPAVSTWVFVLDELDNTTTRLILRNRLGYKSSLGNFLIWRVFTDPISFVMERKMLLGVKQRAEAAAERYGE